MLLLLVLEGWLQWTPTVGWGCSSVGRLSDRHTAEVGLIHWCGKGFFFQSQLSMQTLMVSVHPRVQSHALTSGRTLMILLFMSGVQWVMETLKHPACTVGWVAWLCRSWLSPGKATRISHARTPTGVSTVVTNSIWRAKPEEWPPWLSHRLKCGNRAERLADSEQNLQIRYWRTFAEDEGYQLRSDEGNLMYLTAGARLKISCILPVHTVAQGGKDESLWECILNLCLLLSAWPLQLYFNP